MITYEGIDRNFKFLVVEVQKQLESTFELLRNPKDSLVRSILSRDNYTDTLKTLIEKKCISYFRHTPGIDRSSANWVQAINVATTNLERIGDFCANIAGQVRTISDPDFLQQFDFKPYFEKLLDAVLLVAEVLASVDTGMALQLCRVEGPLDELYKADFKKIRDALQGGGHTDHYLAALYIVHYLERMGDALLNIGEAALYAITGEKLKLHEYQGLSETLSRIDADATMGDFDVEFNWETRSGCRIAKVEEKKGERRAAGAAGGDQGRELEAIFKRGHAEKLRKERANTERWSEVFPGLPPRVLEFRDGDQDAALLLEFLDGFTLRDLVLNGDQPLIDEAVGALTRVLRTVWRATRRDEPTQANFASQAIRRMDDVFRLHPRFASRHVDVGPFSVLSLEELLEVAQRAEADLKAPFSVLIHGDLNSDNVIYNHASQKVHLIDLYRSTESDYVQDLSVFLVSNFRIPVLDGEVRELINRVILQTVDFGARFAEEHGDPLYGARLALGLARSFITSTRFEIDESFANVMYMRAVYLLQSFVNAAPDRLARLTPNTDVLLY